MMILQKHGGRVYNESLALRDSAVSSRVYEEQHGDFVFKRSPTFFKTNPKPKTLNFNLKPSTRPPPCNSLCGIVVSSIGSFEKLPYTSPKQGLGFRVIGWVLPPPRNSMC